MSKASAFASARQVMFKGKPIGQVYGPIVIPDGEESESCVFEVTEDVIVDQLTYALEPPPPNPRRRTVWDAIRVACDFEPEWWPAAENIGAFLRMYGKSTDAACADGRWLKFKRAHAALIVLVARALDIQKDGAPAYRKLFVFDGSPPRMSAPDAKDHDEFEDVLRKNKTLTGEDIVSRIFRAPPPEESLDRLGDALAGLGVF